MEIIRSNKGGNKLCYNGHTYTKKSSSNASIFLVCTNRNRLRRRGSLRSNLQMNNLQEGRMHVDGCRDNTTAVVAKARACMQRCAVETNDKPSLIYANVVSTLDERTLRDLPAVEICKRTIRNHRNPEFLIVPDRLDDLVIDGEWAETLANSRFLLYDNGPESQSRMVVFATDLLLRLLQANTWMMDGNFKLAPAKVLQLYVIRVPLGLITVPVVYALLQHKAQETYEELFNVVIGRCNQLRYQIDPDNVILDFENAAIQALRRVIGQDVHVQGCFYHLTQSTWRKIQDLGLTGIYNEDEEFNLICGMIDALAFLPPDDVQEGMQLLRRIAPIVAEDLLNYFDSIYVSGTLRIVQRNGNNIVRHTPPLSQRVVECMSSNC